ncbi:batten's disease protein Cln3 [Pisolithus marmoratus]|nr:batten's disease protein Cln3 [Pisolithus marmoratus]
MAIDTEQADSERYQIGGISNSRKGERRLLFKLGLSFFVLGLINNGTLNSTMQNVAEYDAEASIALYSTPKGIIAFCNIAPGLFANFGWSYMLKGKLHWHAGIGTVTFLQLSTTYSPAAIGGHCIGCRSWHWDFIPAFLDPTTSIVYSALPLDDPEIPTIDTSEGSSLLGIAPKAESVFLTTADKWRLLETYDTQVHAPTLRPSELFFRVSHRPFCIQYLRQNVTSFLSKIIQSVRDYYPLWQLVYQTTVFISRSTISIGIPPIPVRLLSLPAVVQLAILITLAYESAFGIFSEDHEGRSIAFVFVLVSIEGICGGLAYPCLTVLVSVNVFYQINQERPDPSSVENKQLAKREREFKIGSLAFSDGCGILVASLLAMPTEIELCKLQVARGKLLCQGL